MKKRRFTTAIPYKEYPVAYGHFDKSRKPIDRIVLHTSVSTRQGIINTFGGGSRKVSAHYAVDLDGSLLAFLEEYYTAYHAGNYAMNQRSIGIEHIDNGRYNDPRPDALYETSAKLVADICKFYDIPCDRQHILKHNEITATGCPHNLDVDRIVREAKKILEGGDGCEKDLEEAHRHIENLQNQVNGLVKDLDDCKKVRDENMGRVKELTKQVEECKSGLGDKEAKIKQLTDELQRVKEAYKKEVDSQVDFGEQAAKEEAKRKDIENEFSNFLSELEVALKMSKSNDKRSVRIKRVLNMIDTKQYEELEKQFEELVVRYEDLVKENEELRKKAARKRRKLSNEPLSALILAIIDKFRR